jgi:hypothetical protein
MTIIESTQCNHCISMGGGDCATCKPEPEKPQSVRSQRSFQEQMKTLYQNIDTLVYAGEEACAGAHANKECPLGSECPFHKAHQSRFPFGCALIGLRQSIGDHFPQSDITIADDNTQAGLKEKRG